MTAMARHGRAVRGVVGLGIARQSAAMPNVARAMAAFLATVAIASPSEAATCHHFSRWFFPFPQRCGAARVVHRSLAEPKDWYVEIVLTPQVLDEISHGVGIERIKQLQAGKDGAHAD